MDFSATIHGTRVVAELKARITRGLVVIGSDVFSRSDLAAVECYCFTAASNLSHILATIRVANGNRKIENTRDLFHNVPPEALMVPRL